MTTYQIHSRIVIDVTIYGAVCRVVMCTVDVVIDCADFAVTEWSIVVITINDDVILSFDINIKQLNVLYL